jgi:predicted ferric reductase
MKHVAKTPGAKAIDLIHSTKEVSPQALGLLKATAADAGVALHVLVDYQDGFLTGERLRKLVPHWKSALVWLCGLAAFGQALRGDLVANGLATNHFHQEVFNMR